MSRYTADSRDRVRDAVDMVRLIESRVELRKTGVDSYFGCCPFHDERTPSFHVRPDEKHYHCFGCSESGDPFDFVMALEGLDFKGALETLADRFGVSLETVDEDPEAAARRAHRERLYGLLTRTATFYERMLWEAREAEPARRYLLNERALDPEVLRRFRVGWAPEGWDRVLLGSRRVGFSDEEMLSAGLIQRSRKDTSRLYDRFRAQIMFPTADTRGRVIGFGARKLPGDTRDWLGKYVNTAEGDLYSKRAVLYGIQEARGPAAKAGRMVLAEGYTDVIALHQAGVTHAVGIMGTSLTREQVAELVRLVGTLELCLDADAAGQEAMARAAHLCAQTGLELRVVALPAGADPGELITRAGPAALADRVATSVPYVVFAVRRILGAADLSSAEGKDAAISDLAPALANVPESVLLDELRRSIAAALEINEGRVLSLLSGAGAAGRRGDTADGGGPRAEPWPSRVAGAEARARSGAGPRDEGNSGPRSAGARSASDGVASAAELGVNVERSFLAACLAGGEAGRAELARVDPDRLLTSAVLRRVLRRLNGQLEIPAGPASPSGPSGPAEPARLVGRAVAEEHVSAALEDLQARADRAAAMGRIVTPEQIEHARLLLELAHVERQLVGARLRGEGIADLAHERQRVKQSLGQVLARLERPL